MGNLNHNGTENPQINNKNENKSSELANKLTTQSRGNEKKKEDTKKIKYTTASGFEKPSRIGMNALTKKTGIGRTRFYEFLREEGVFDSWNRPTEKFRKYFFSETKWWIHGNGYNTVWLINPEGAELILNLVKTKYVKKTPRKRRKSNKNNFETRL